MSICYNKQEFDSGSDECLEFVLYSASFINWFFNWWRKGE